LRLFYSKDQPKFEAILFAAEFFVRFAGHPKNFELVSDAEVLRFLVLFHLT